MQRTLPSTGPCWIAGMGGASATLRRGSDLLILGLRGIREYGIGERFGIRQRMLNAIELGSSLPIHRHRHTSETVVCLRGRRGEYYDELERICAEAIEVSPNGHVVALNVSAGRWHTVRALESGSVILEMKEGAYEALSDTDILSL